MAPTCSLGGSVALWVEGSEKEPWPLPAVLYGRKLFPSPFPDARHFSSSLYATGAFLAATPLLELRVSESEFSSCVGPLRANAWDSSSIFHQLILVSAAFYSQKL